jgi:hypothetical protein
MTLKTVTLKTRNRSWGAVGVVALALAGMAGAVAAPQTASAQEAKKPSKFRKFADVTSDAKKIEGLFDLYHDNQHLYANLGGGDFDRPFLAPMSIARGAASAGMALNFDEQWVISFKRVGDYVHLIRKNLRYEAPKGSPLEKAVQQNYTDSVLMALPIVSDDAPGGGVLIDLADIFFTDFADLAVGGLDRSRTSWNSIKAYPQNLELQVNVTFNSDPMGMGANGDSGYIDDRGITVVLHYSIVAMPDGGYRSRLADQRVGYFLNATRTSARKIPTRRSCGGSTGGGWRRPTRALSCRSPRSKSCGGSRTPCRTNTGRTSRTAFWSGTRRSRRSASATP